ncbi:MAG: DUF1249 domain-containing protein [Aeromonadaceae bacterium]
MSLILQQRRHVPDLANFHRVCETNYMGLMKLMPSAAFEQGGYAFCAANGLEFHLRVLDESRFTTLLEVAQNNENLPHYLRAYLQVRLYHDARMAEVCVSQQISRLRPSYDYPNQKMHHRDEKEQCNHFLAEWLHFCLTHGYGVFEFIPD